MTFGQIVLRALVAVEEVAIDGTRVRARAGPGSFAKRERLGRIEAAVAKRVAALKSELEQDAAAAERRRQERALRPTPASPSRLTLSAILIVGVHVHL